MDRQIESIINILTEFSGIEFESTDYSVTVLPENENGFLVSISVEPEEFIIQWGNCHRHFEIAQEKDEALNLFWAGLTNITRIRAYSHESDEFQWIYEIKEKDTWEVIDNTKFLFHKFWKPKVEKIYQNSLIDSNILSDSSIQN